MAVGGGADRATDGVQLGASLEQPVIAGVDALVHARHPIPVIQSHARPRARAQPGWTVIGNPASGRGRGRQALEQATAVLVEAGASPAVVHARDLEHATAAAGEAAAAGGTVVAVGGDGIVGAVAGALAGTPGALGIVPAGRGNDFARSLGLPLDAGAAARRLPAATARRVDVGDVDGRPFVGIASVGIDAEANRLANGSSARLGEAVYAVSGVRALAAWRHATFTLEIDGTPSTFRGFGLGVGNAPYYGGGLRALPDARVDDGLLDVVTFAQDRRLRFLRQIPQRRTGGHAANPTVGFSRGTVVRVTADRPLAVYADGEPIGALPATVTIRPGALSVLA